MYNMDNMDSCSFSSTQLTPAQRTNNNVSDVHEKSIDSSQTCAKQLFSAEFNDTADNSSQTCVKQLYTAEPTDIDVNNGTSVLDDLCAYEPPPDNHSWALVTKLQDFFVDLTEADFIAKVISEADGKEARLEEMRDAVYDCCKSSEGYPFSINIPLKRRLYRSKGEGVVYKLAHDVYTLVSVIEGSSFDALKDVLSLPRKHRGDMNNTISEQDSSYCISEISLLKNKFVEFQADIMKIKEDKVSQITKLNDEIKSIKSDMQKLRKENNDEITSIKTDIQKLRKENTENFETLYRSIQVNSQSIGRVEDEKSSGFKRVKISLKLLENDLKDSKDYVDSQYDKSNTNISNMQRKFDKHIGKLESKMYSIDKTVQALSTPSNTNHDDAIRIPIEQCDKTISHENSSNTNVNGENLLNIANIQRVNNENNQAPKTGSGNEPLIPCQQDLYSETVQKAPPLRDAVPATTPDGNQIPVRISRDEHQNVPNSQRVKQGLERNENAEDDDLFAGFKEHIVRKTRRFYIGGFKSSIMPKAIVSYVESKGIKVTMLRIFPLRNSNSVIMRLNVEIPKSELLTSAGCWPEGVVCRPWVTKRKYEERHGNQESKQTSRGNAPESDTRYRNGTYNDHVTHGENSAQPFAGLEQHVNHNRNKTGRPVTQVTQQNNQNGPRYTRYSYDDHSRPNVRNDNHNTERQNYASTHNNRYESDTSDQNSHNSERHQYASTYNRYETLNSGR